MNDRMKGPVRLATIFIVVILSVSVSMSFTRDRDARFDFASSWEIPVSNVQSLQIIDLDHDGSDDLFTQTPNAWTVIGGDEEGGYGDSQSPPISMTMGDANSDGRENLVVFEADGRVTALSVRDTLWSTQLQGVGGASRAAVIRFGSGTQVVAGDDRGQLVGLDGRTGVELWRQNFDGQSETRGLDDALYRGDRLLVAANRGGRIMILGPDGSVRDSGGTNGIRRMRTFDADGDGQSEIYFGGEAGTVFVHDPDGVPRWQDRIGQQVVEIRDGELDGDPGGREIVVGGRDGGVFAYRADGSEVWSGNIGERVSDLVTVDLDNDGTDEVVAGGTQGRLIVFSGLDGVRIPVDFAEGPIDALDEGFLSAPGQVVIAAGRGVRVGTLTRQNAPLFYTPLAAGLLLSLAIAGAAIFVGRLPERMSSRVVVTDSSPEGLLARRRMLFENIADVEQLRGEGEIEGEAALAKLEELRQQLAETDQELRTANVDVGVQTMKCPNCGGRVRLGTDRCDYCGEVVIA